MHAGGRGGLGRGAAMDEPLNPHAQAAPVVWIIADDRTGHRNQLCGVVHWLATLGGARCEWLDAPPSAWRGAAWWLAGRFPPGEGLPAPDWIVVAGQRTHWAGLAARRAFGGHVAVLMRPSLPYAWFDLCCVPQHDSPPARNNVLRTLGVANAVVPSASRTADAGLVLVGGPSRHHGWDATALAAQVAEIVRATPQVRFTLADSRRSPPGTLAALHTALGGAADVMPVADAPEGWLAQALAQAAVVWVTADSVSMVFEAITSGAAVGVLPVPQKRASRVAQAVDAAVQAELATPFARWQATHALPPPARPLLEARRIAEAILARN